MTASVYPNYRALISVHIPYSSFQNRRSDHKPTVKKIADKTQTHIESNELSHLYKIRFCIFGKWRDCLLAGRLLWYHLIRETTIYINSDWMQVLSEQMKDQSDKPFRHLYRNVEYNRLNEYKLISISGICWDVLKVRRELLKRNVTKIQSEGQINGNNKTDLMALQILNSIRAEINDDIHSPDSLYSIRSNQLLHLITGFKCSNSVHTFEDIGRQNESKHSSRNSSESKKRDLKEVKVNQMLTNPRLSLKSDETSESEKFETKQIVVNDLALICPKELYFNSDSVNDMKNKNKDIDYESNESKLTEHLIESLVESQPNSLSDNKNRKFGSNPINPSLNNPF